jgi:hypothetical protein
MMSDHEWLNLIDISGPFLAGPVLSEHFPTGLEAVPTKIRQRLRSTFEEWQLATDGDDPDAALVHEAWIENVLTEVLEFEARVLKTGDDLPEDLIVAMPEHGTSIRPDMALVDTTGDGNGLFLIHILEPRADLEGSIQVDGWVTTPVERMTTLLRATECPVGMITNGDQWMLVHASVGEVVSTATWHARIWLQETDTLRAFVSLLRVSRFFGPPQEKLPALFEKSKGHQDKVTEALGDQVARAIEVLIQSLDHADEERNRELLKVVKPADLYEAGLTVMMRLVFLLAAEERDLILLGDPKYDAFYAVSNLRGQLRLKTDELLERDHSAWSQLLAVFRMVYGGVEHPALRLPALGGSLFDPDRFPFLEGRAKSTSWRTEPAVPLPIDDRTVLLLLEAIQIFKGRTLSYKGLDVEQIGHVYEGLLEKTVRRVENTTLELKSSNSAKNPFVTLDRLDEALGQGGSSLKDLIVDRSGRSANAVQNDMDREMDEALIGKLLTTCSGDNELSGSVAPYAALLQEDAWGYPLVHPKGAFVIGLGQDRRESGSHYTPKSLTERIVEETLAPVAYVGPAEGMPREEWQLKSAEDILNLKICDPAMGSGAFLVQVCSWLSDRLVEAWAIGDASGQRFDVDGNKIEGGVVEMAEQLPNSPEERSIVAKRVIAEKCLYGVDVNPLAVELAKLSLWLTTLSKGHPFGFLDHNLKSGNSLLGIDNVNQVIDLSMTPGSTPQGRLFGQSIKEAVDKATDIRLRLRKIPIRDIQDVEAMAGLDDQSQEALALPVLLADALVGIELAETNARARGEWINVLAGLADEVARGNEAVRTTIRNESMENLNMDNPTGLVRKPFHWALEFPEVFGRKVGGFDAVVGNPPFLGGQRITGASGVAFRDFVVRNVAGDRKGSADLVAYFFLRSYRILREGGGFGLLAVNTISQGNTRQVGLEPMVASGAVIHAAYPNEAWPGKAAVVTSRIHVHKGDWLGERSLLGRLVLFISAFLSDREEWSPEKLKGNEGIAFKGSGVTGLGFVLEPNEAQRMLDDDPRNADVIFQYLNGQNLNSDPEQNPHRWIINFWDWPEERAITYQLPYEHVMANVKPERQRKKENGEYALSKNLRENWWRFERTRPALYHAVGRGEHFESHPEGWPATKYTFSHIVVCSQISKHLGLAIVPNDIVFDQRLVVFADDGPLLPLLQSNINLAWVQVYGSSLNDRMTYTPSDCFETFPLPQEDVDFDFEVYLSARQAICKQLDLGIGKIFNQIHDPTLSDRSVEKVRDLSCEMDIKVAEAYGWDDLDLQHDFHEVSYLPESDCVRFTISEDARVEVLKRLADLNKERYSEEVAQGLHKESKAKKAKKTKRKKASNTERQQSSMDI